MDHWLTWTACAVLLFWGVGAYNRLVRLRAEAHAAFAAVEAEFTRQVELVRGELPPPQPGGSEGLFVALHAAATQFAATLAAARARPLEPGGIAALSAAEGVLSLAWERVEREDAHDLAGPRLPENLSLRRAQLALQARAAAEQFNAAVARYNAAIAQFPALLLALLFGFRPGRSIEARLPGLAGG
ncbi:MULTISPECIES: LemA family protein [Ramlibacter]|uniref:LemA family protein n=1 Tax=Ramlibacter aquaticus TaxID=2780094 RepID=A0ABR9SI82_9BURK|nr:MULTISPECIES: LemA family protein [Ramlibacter]MBE7942076.1 LemA family protein [Ramlibacter aquaticus]